MGPEMMAGARTPAKATENAVAAAEELPAADNARHYAQDSALSVAHDRRRVHERRMVQALAAASGVGTWDWDLRAGLLYADQGLADIFGFDPDLAASGLPPNAYIERIFAEDRPGVELALAPALAAAGDYIAEYRVPARDGGVRWISARGRSMVGPDGSATQLLGLAVDVTERRLGEEALAAEHARLAAILEHVPVGIAICDANGRIEMGNPQIERIVRHPIIFCSDVTEHADWVSFHADGRRVEGHEYPLPRALADGRTHTGDYHYLRGDGSLAWIKLNAAPILDAQGRVTGGVVALAEIDDYKLAQEALEAKEKLLRMATEAVGLGIFKWHIRADRLTWENARISQIFGYSLEQMPERPSVFAGRMLHPEDRDHFLSAMKEATSAHGGLHLECRILRADGSAGWAEFTGRLVDEAGAHVRMQIGVLDVSRARITEAALRQAEKLAVVGRLASSLAHEINNPLDAARNTLFLVRMLDLPEEARKLLETAEQELRRISEIVGRTLRIHKQSAGPQRIGSRELIFSALGIFEGKLRNTRIAVQPDTFAEETLLCLEGEIRQVLSNLIANTIDAMPQGGRLRLRSRHVSTERRGRCGVVLTVADTGSGMTAEVKRSVFEPFYTTKGLDGTGLGLWISHEIVARHQGTMRVRSRVGSGTVFRIFLPIDDLP